MNTFVDNLVYLGVLVFAAFLVIFGMVKLIKVLKGDAEIGPVLLSIAGVLVGAGLVIWAATDFKGDRIIITTVGSWITTILTEPLGG
ncbi:MAG: hypothetical protein UU64_C0002G0040 [candidate division WWE3 bacterium GW2011_GWF2_41_45]|uniref:Uncharacterized protein n=1 Tax=candidate division WWE3 bacterium GW2011_GWC2_41_23 TaxID=1619123 RepID=A0A0G0VVE9_UNCKA|nr:MAG: hypothetical protein UU55_C0001G0078 [candidate division WWE3 bacterium GW2011_GWC2_41_23]KKS10638.1 MAG: hypothetical protein UU64_C0002G0040 [candidate division WWE3 bacterium GW2011_GWF2_41_45]KKS12351.1 MAG: hypothetical protein UU68_C0002G0077 [candidate division WWE3 bacterium GW2011_GWF1_41_53]KKS20425.1 MAG: hypothetical protein UU79_C0001G0079 [candidate division WWE3 bacterium GW2011_GWE1_41_72]KKS27154.1 MAG: hypothetical protein UU86_C0024G0002 [candidate division WWE3 bacte